MNDPEYMMGPGCLYCSGCMCSIKACYTCKYRLAKLITGQCGYEYIPVHGSAVPSNVEQMVDEAYKQWKRGEIPEHPSPRRGDWYWNGKRWVCHNL